MGKFFVSIIGLDFVLGTLGCCKVEILDNFMSSMFNWKNSLTEQNGVYWNVPRSSALVWFYSFFFWQIDRKFLPSTLSESNCGYLNLKDILCWYKIHEQMLPFWINVQIDSYSCPFSLAHKFENCLMSGSTWTKVYEYDAGASEVSVSTQCTPCRYDKWTAARDCVHLRCVAGGETSWRTIYRKDHIYNSAYYSDIYNGLLCSRTALFGTGKKHTYWW